MAVNQVRVYDLCLAWNWEYDSDFARLIEEACAARGLTLLNVNARTLTDSLSRLAGREAGFRTMLDRASESDPTYLPLVEIARALAARRLNPRELADRAYDKAAMHNAFLEAGLHTPPTLILPAYCDQPVLPPLDLPSLGGLFTAKPALGGGGEGVVMEITSLEQVLVARKQFPEQKYLLQAHVTPRFVDGLPAWFRVIYCLGEIYPSFWNTTTHVYTLVPVGAVTQDCPARNYPEGGHAGPPQITSLLANLREIIERIADICRLDLFSSEIALTGGDQFLVVDYVNDPIDLRLQSRVVDGVPDEIVKQIAARVVKSVRP